MTGSKYLVSNGQSQILVDCGLFQGLKMLRLKNWSAFPVEPSKIEAVVLTHAHLDHSGYLPLLVRQGFRGKVFCTPATERLCQILLPDSGRLQEEETRFANRRGYSKHHPALPLYTEEDAKAALSYLNPIDFHVPFSVTREIKGRFSMAGHILGAACVILESGGKRLVFSGDLGRQNDLIMLPPENIEKADYLVVESTYGGKRHDPVNPLDQLQAAINRTVGRGGVLVIPSFAVGRAQSLLYAIHTLKKAKKIPHVPLYVNSPMAIDATNVFCAFQDEHRLSPEECRQASQAATYVHDAEDSKALNERRDPMIIIAASGMATGGRILHHLEAFAPDPKNTILFTGFQAEGTRGDSMVKGAKQVKIHGHMVDIAAEVVSIDTLSAHADQSEIMTWLKGFKASPQKTFITHGEPEGAAALKQVIEQTLHWDCVVPKLMDEAALA